MAALLLVASARYVRLRQAQNNDNVPRCAAGVAAVAVRYAGWQWSVIEFSMIVCNAQLKRPLPALHRDELRKSHYYNLRIILSDPFRYRYPYLRTSDHRPQLLFSANWKSRMLWRNVPDPRPNIERKPHILGGRITPVPLPAKPHAHPNKRATYSTDSP